MRSRSVLNFLVRLRLDIFVVFENSSSVGAGGGRTQVPFSILVSCCFFYVSRSECPMLPSVFICSGFCGGH